MPLSHDMFKTLICASITHASIFMYLFRVIHIYNIVKDRGLVMFVYACISNLRCEIVH
jgi:hypothetical protein